MDFSQYDKSDSIMRGKNVIVLQNLDGLDTKKILIELSTASSSAFDYPEGHIEEYDNLDLTAKVVQACLREYYVNCIDATTEAAVEVDFNNPFLVTVDFVEYYFNNIADYLERKHILPSVLDTEVLRFKDACSDATFESVVKFKVDQPFSITINNGTKYTFENIDDFIAQSTDLFDAELQFGLLTPLSEIPVKRFTNLTSKPFPVINREEVNITSYSILESSKHLTLSPSLLESATVNYGILEATIATRIPQVYGVVSIESRPSYNDPETFESQNVSLVNSSFKIFDPVILSPLKTNITETETVASSYSIGDPMLRDNLIRGYDDITETTLSYKVNDVVILDIVQDFTTEINSIKTNTSVGEVTLREHSIETHSDVESINYGDFNLPDATTRDQLIIAHTPLEALQTTSTVLEPTLRDHLNKSTLETISLDTVFTLPDAYVKKDLHTNNHIEDIGSFNSVKDAYMIRSLHLNYDEVAEVMTTVNIPDPDISGDAIVQISCIGAVEQTQDITMNGTFSVFLNDSKLNQQPMTVQTLKTLLAAYGIEIEIISE